MSEKVSLPGHMCWIMFLVSLQVLLVKASWCINCENLTFPMAWYLKQTVKIIQLKHKGPDIQLCSLKCTGEELEYYCSYRHVIPSIISHYWSRAKLWCHITLVIRTMWIMFVLFSLQEISPPCASWELSSRRQIDETPRQDSQRCRGCHRFSW